MIFYVWVLNQLAMVDYLAVDKPNPEISNQIGEGLSNGAIEARDSYDWW